MKKKRYTVICIQNGNPARVCFFGKDGIKPWTESKREANKEAAALNRQGTPAAVYESD